MEYRITLQGVKPFSINKAHYRNGARTRENREWAHRVHEQIGEDKGFYRFKKIAKKASHFHVSLTFNMPQENFYTKTGKISRLTSDLSNIEKGLIDLIFDKRFQGRKERGVTYQTLECDDCLITQLISVKRPHASSHYTIDIVIHAFN